MMNAIINVYKEKGYTSHDVVAILRKKLFIKRIGHTGTLDPEAEGVLPICIGKATKAVEFLTDKEKTYEASMVLGITTDTQDHTGKVIKESDVNVSEEEIIMAIKSFIGNYEQIPPMYSAIKVNGKKLYELAREGKVIERKARSIYIDKIDNICISGKNISFEVTCSKGTYIRTLCHDIGEKLQCGGHMTSLVRTRSGKFTLDNSLKLDEIIHHIEEDTIDKIVLSIDNVFMNYPKLIVKNKFNKIAFNGNKLSIEMIETKETLVDNYIYRIYDDNDQFIGIYNYNKELLKPEKLFI